MRQLVPAAAPAARVNHETRGQAEACPTVEDLILKAHRTLEHHGVHASPAKVSKLVRRFVRARDDGARMPAFEQYVVNTVCTVPLRPMRGARNEFNVVDEPGETVARYHEDVDPNGIAARRRSAVRQAREARRG